MTPKVSNNLLRWFITPRVSLKSLQSTLMEHVNSCPVLRGRSAGGLSSLSIRSPDSALACNDIAEVHALLRDMQLTAQKAISQRGLRSGRVLSLTNRSLNHGSGSG